MLSKLNLNKFSRKGAENARKIISDSFCFLPGLILLSCMFSSLKNKIVTPYKKLCDLCVLA